MSEATQSTEETPELTHMDEFELEEAVEGVERVDSARCVTQADVWAVFHVDTDEFAETLQAAMNQPDVVVHKAERKEGALSIALEKFADCL